ncbi:hypothetical protein SAMN05444580_1233 [Rhodococcus tukisamuensis]|uniref:Uncharacterized protein n=1 Tax=Rhodococcus tukisamuensis TaxID=168276 RepID=A0A1G7E901_9NOCA|nr:hypothetical protein SAMN05444580_1233 [Rhodococcus tukisamuensis]
MVASVVTAFVAGPDAVGVFARGAVRDRAAPSVR